MKFFQPMRSFSTLLSYVVQVTGLRGVEGLKLFSDYVQEVFYDGPDQTNFGFRGLYLSLYFCYRGLQHPLHIWFSELDEVACILFLCLPAGAEVRIPEAHYVYHFGLPKGSTDVFSKPNLGEYW